MMLSDWTVYYYTQVLTATLVSFLKYSSINDDSTAFPKYSITTFWQNAALSSDADVSETAYNTLF